MRHAYIVAPATLTAAVAVALFGSLALPHQGYAASKRADTRPAVVSRSAVPGPDATARPMSATQCRAMMGQNSMGMGHSGAPIDGAGSMGKWFGA